MAQSRSTLTSTVRILNEKSMVHRNIDSGRNGSLVVGLKVGRPLRSLATQ